MECYQSLIRLKKFSKPTRKSMVSSGFSVKRKGTRLEAQRSELVAIMGCGVDLQHLVTVSRKYFYILASFISLYQCLHKTFCRLTFYCDYTMYVACLTQRFQRPFCFRNSLSNASFTSRKISCQCPGRDETKALR